MLRGEGSRPRCEVGFGGVGAARGRADQGRGHSLAQFQRDLTEWDLWVVFKTSDELARHGVGFDVPLELDDHPRCRRLHDDIQGEQRTERVFQRLRDIDLPVSFSASTGVSTSTVPIFDSGGHPAPAGEDDVSASSCWVVHTPSPEPEDGLTV